MCKLVFIVVIFIIGSFCQYSLTSKEVELANRKANSIDKKQTTESEIYRAVLDGYEEKYGSTKLLIVNETTSGSVSPDNSLEKVVLYLEKKIRPGIPKEIIQNFRKENEKPHKFQIDFDTKVKYSMLERENISQLEDSSSVNSHSVEGGLLHLSRIGFSPDGQTALVYIGYWGGTRTGWGYYTILEKKEGKWVVTDKILAWLS